VGAQKRFGENCFQMPLMSVDMGRTVARKSSVGVFFMFVQGARHSENLYSIHNMNSICRLCKLIISRKYP